MINKRGEYFNEIETKKDNPVGKFFNVVLWGLIIAVSVIVIYVLGFKR